MTFFVKTHTFWKKTLYLIIHDLWPQFSIIVTFLTLTTALLWKFRYFSFHWYIICPYCPPVHYNG